ncbi:MAG: acyl-CoA dehydrogenase family protein [Thermodesulfobacteriota bacterium]
MANQDSHSLVARVRAFASEHLAHRGDLALWDRFPHDLWTRMGELGLCAMAVPERFGGAGAGYGLLARSLDALVFSGKNLGIAASLMLNNLVALFAIDRLGTEDQKADFLPAIADGSSIACLAMSEPKTGAHPGRMRTQARREEGFFVLDGEKAYLTNGPVAGLFVVAAVTGEEKGRKQISAFLLPRRTPGLTVGADMGLDFLRPSPHGPITLDGCRVPEGYLLGTPGTAWEDLIKPFRTVEDVLMMAAAAGGMDLQLSLLTEIMAGKKEPPTLDMVRALGLFACLVATLRTMAFEAADLLDQDFRSPKAEQLSLAARFISRDVQSLVNRLLGESSLDKESELYLITQDLRKSSEIAKNAETAKQERMGSEILARVRSKRE